MSGNRASNDGDLVRRWCVAGQGLAVKSCIDMAADLMAVRVVRVMPDYRPPVRELWLARPSRQLPKPAARLLRDKLRKRTREILAQLVEKGLLKKDALP